MGQSINLAGKCIKSENCGAIVYLDEISMENASKLKIQWAIDISCRYYNGIHIKTENSKLMGPSIYLAGIVMENASKLMILGSIDYLSEISMEIA